MDPLTFIGLILLALILVLTLRMAFWPAARGGAADSAILDRLLSIKGDVERLDRVVREDGEQARTGADERGRQLRNEVTRYLTDSRTEMSKDMTAIRTEIVTALEKASKELRESSTELSKIQKERLDDVGVKLTGMTQTLEANLTALRTENTAKLEEMRVTVDEKLQGTLEKRLGESFKQVSEHLEAVHKGLGVMQTLATGVGDLNKVLTNVKIRGTWGETQLANLLAQVFSPEQYLVNAITRPGSQERVEFAIRLPGRGPEDQEVLLPIDAKFHREDYERLVDASERGDAAGVETAAKALDARIKGAAKDIRDKYLNPPHTTDFAILFLPTEGLYAEILRRPGLAELLQHDFRVTIAGPTTLNAILNSLLMGFRTLAIQSRSSEVWKTLGAVKTEFAKYGDVLDKVQKKLQDASRSVDDVAVRHRAVSRSLRDVADPAQLQSQIRVESPALTQLPVTDEDNG